MTRIAVTGAAGFIGSQIAERLVRDGCEVVGVDCFTANYERAVKERNLATLRSTDAFELVESSIDEPAAEAAFRGCRAVIHLAALPGVRSTLEDEIWRMNVTALAGMLTLLARARVERLVLASSSSIYGSLTRPGTELDEPAPASAYARSKLAAEQLCAQSGLDCVTLRYFTVYGERQRPDMAFARFIDAALGNRSAPLFASGTQVRHFTYVGDVVEATVRALNDAPRGAVYNVASPSAATPLDAIALIERYTGHAVATRELPPQPQDAEAILADVSRARRELGWHAQTSLADGLRAQVQAALEGIRGEPLAGSRNA
jgi:nucleoside-diphosphate-sugar epimerase